MRWAALWIILIALVLVPFFLFEEQFNALGARLAAGEGSSWTSAGAIAGLLALDIVLPVPSSIVSTAAGVLLGFAKGTAVCFIGMTVGSWSGYWIGASASNWTRRFVGEESLKRASAMMSRYGDWALALCRPVPVLAEASVVFAGMTRMPRARFGWLTALSNLGISLGYAAIGAYSMKVESFLLAFAGAIAIPAVGLAVARLWNRAQFVRKPL